MRKPRVGDVVRLDCPAEPKWDGLLATVHALHDTHAVVRHRYFQPVKDAPPGEASYRAGWHELQPVGRGGPPVRAAVGGKPGAADAKAQGFEGESCTQCGAMKLLRNGSCLLCAECGSTTGCS